MALPHSYLTLFTIADLELDQLQVLLALQQFSLLLLNGTINFTQIDDAALKVLELLRVNASKFSVLGVVTFGKDGAELNDALVFLVLLFFLLLQFVIDQLFRHRQVRFRYMQLRQLLTNSVVLVQQLDVSQGKSPQLLLQTDVLSYQLGLCGVPTNRETLVGFCLFKFELFEFRHTLAHPAFQLVLPAVQFRLKSVLEVIPSLTELGDVLLNDPEADVVVLDVLECKLKLVNGRLRSVVGQDVLFLQLQLLIQSLFKQFEGLQDLLVLFLQLMSLEGVIVSGTTDPRDLALDGLRQQRMVHQACNIIVAIYHALLQQQTAPFSQNDQLTQSVHWHRAQNLIIFTMFTQRIPSMRFLYSLLKDEITFTPSFKKALSKKLQTKSDQQFLRLEIAAGEGCEGYTYKFRFDTQLNDKDFVQTTSQARVEFALAEQQLRMIRGATVDYASELMREAFYVKQNPNAELSCSCKTSFSPREFTL